MENFETFDNNQKLPNEQISLIGSIISLVLCLFSCCCGLFTGIPGLIISIITLVLANKDITAYNANPNRFSEKTYHNTKLAKKLSIVTIVLSIISIVLTTLYLVGSIVLPESVQEFKNNFPQSN